MTVESSTIPDGPNAIPDAEPLGYTLLGDNDATEDAVEETSLGWRHFPRDVPFMKMGMLN